MNRLEQGSLSRRPQRDAEQEDEAIAPGGLFGLGIAETKDFHVL